MLIGSVFGRNSIGLESLQTNHQLQEVKVHHVPTFKIFKDVNYLAFRVYTDA